MKRGLFPLGQHFFTASLLAKLNWILPQHKHHVLANHPFGIRPTQPWLGSPSSYSKLNRHSSSGVSARSATVNSHPENAESQQLLESGTNQAINN